ncbi:unnamed protein product [Hydatigera taeniaeformis]|uniref:Acyl carrier protein n=1 Tax=Hydatigena taeniaeformis TaxID=6205 RepID=A0A158REH2_HYDTA|nr:unnamed protein product [Hydatigera taeniaeformis]
MSASSAKLDFVPANVGVTRSNISVNGSSDGDPTIRKPMPLWRKLAFASGGLPMQMMQNVISFFLPLFLLETVSLAPYFLSVILLAARISDAVTDPLVGMLVLKTKSRFGQKRPWILFSTPVFVASFFALFYAVYWPAPAKLCFYLISIIILQFGLTSFHIPYSSLTMVLTHIPEERDLLTAFRMFSEVLAILFGVAVFGAIIAPYRVVSSCEDSVFTNGTVDTNSTKVTFTSQPFVHPDARRREAWAYMTAASVTCVICAVASLICFFGTREEGSNLNATIAGAQGEGDGDGDDTTTVGFVTAVQKVLTNPPYLYLMGAFLFMSLGIQFLQGNIALFITHSLHMSNYLIPGVLCLLGFTILLVPLAQVLLRHLGKKTTMAIGIANVIPLLVLLNFIPERPSLWIFFGMMIWASVTIAVAMLLPWSMLPDVIDAFQLKHNMRLESIFYSLIVFFNKFAVGISLAMSAGILGLVGYDSSSSACYQPPAVGKTLRLLSSIAPICFLIPALIFLYFYPLGNRELEEMRSKLLLRFSHGPPLTKPMIEDRVMLVLQLYDKIDPNKLTLKSDLAKDFGLDSLDMVEVNVAMEEEFTFDIPSADAQRLRTPFDIVHSESDEDLPPELRYTTEEVMRAKETNPGMFVSAWQADEEDITYWSKKDLRKDPKKLFILSGQRGDLETIKSVLQTEIGPDWANHPSKLKEFLLAHDDDGYTALHRAVYSGHVETAEFLLRYGAQLETQTVDGWRPLHSAAFWNQLACVQLLLEVGADVTAANNQTAETLVYLLSQLSADPDVFENIWRHKNASGDTPAEMLVRSSSMGTFLLNSFGPEATNLGTTAMLSSMQDMKTFDADHVGGYIATHDYQLSIKTPEWRNDLPEEYCAQWNLPSVISLPAPDVGLGVVIKLRDIGELYRPLASKFLICPTA